MRSSESTSAYWFVPMCWAMTPSINATRLYDADFEFLRTIKNSNRKERMFYRSSHGVSSIYVSAATNQIILEFEFWSINTKKEQQSTISMTHNTRLTHKAQKKNNKKQNIKTLQILSLFHCAACITCCNMSVSRRCRRKIERTVARMAKYFATSHGMVISDVFFSISFILY